ncbi:PREDICTED: uncharacterized protein LOC108661595 [Theobroma cacao]|uniref:Uncharacterized protein LOC108661595 n=1 Tax=Theobroma cacao TaxID=3641 RepID=A0AB32WA84_THECC|nr:PREDICTED: uncharacterized protein LOC108661595 [Theobroma cacao]
MIERMRMYCSMDAIELCLVPDVVIPQKFKVPDFEKYDKVKCLVTHITMYCKRMGAYAHDDKLLIHCFQDSLTGVAAKRYVQLDRNRIHTWKDLAREFVAQYKHVTDMAPDRLSLQNMEKKPTESLKEYSQRWRNVASQVQPPLIEKETTVMFVNTPRAPYYERLVGSAIKNFTDMVILGEMIETAIKQKKIEGGDTANTKKWGTFKNSEGETQAIISRQPQGGSYNPYQPYPPYPYYPVVNNTSQRAYLYPPMPNAFSNLYPYAPTQRTPYPTNIHPPTFTPLVANHLVAPLYIEPLKPPFPIWYDAFAHCDYHYGIKGHSIENCTAFKHKVQGLIKAGILNFEKKLKQNVNNNPLPNHAGARVNIIEEEVYVKRNIREVETPMQKVFETLVKADMLEVWPECSDVNDSGDIQEPYCLYHKRCVGHLIQDCSSFRKEVQRMMDESRIEFYVEALEPAVNMMSKESTHPRKIKLLTIFYERRGESVEDRTHAKMTIEVPKPFPYKDNKAVPWNYNCNVQVSNTKKLIAESQNDAANITGVGGITRSGCCYTLEALENLRKEKEKEKELPARISLLSLLLSSDPHKNALMRILNQAYVDHDISIEDLDYIVGNISMGNIISFSDEEISSRGKGNYKALHITTKCKGCTVTKVLFDNGSSLNVIPMRTLARLPIDMSYMRKSQMIVRAFDGTRRAVVGDIEIPIEIDLCTFTIEFQVMDIAPSYNYLLGRPCIHLAGAIPSSLHQKVKFIVDGKIVCVNGEEELLISKPANTPYVGAAEEVSECFFRSFEFVNTTYVGEETTPPIPRLSKTTVMVVSQMVGKRYRAEVGLGRELQGIRRPIRATKNEERFGLGYKPTKKEREEMIAERKRERLARFKGHRLENHRMIYPHLYETFRSGGFIFLNHSLLGAENQYQQIPNNECEDDNDSDFEVNFEKGTSVSELDNTENVKNYDLTPDLLRLLEQEGRQIVPHQETLETINLGNEENKKEVRIGTTLVPSEKEKLIKLLHEYVNVFAWSYQDMPGLNTDIVAHKLPLKPECKPIKQKLRRMKPEMLLKIKEEVKKQFDARFLEIAKYPEWVANIVPVLKKVGKVRMCVDYRDLNRASPKDNFPLPHIDTLVDNTARHSMFSFMDGFSRYNQIKMAPEDREKTTFITMWGTFCYKVMPFSLKNIGVTYQRAMVTLFHDMMHREVEVYVDDMIVKALKTEDHATNLERLFKRLRKFQLRLNLGKCTFGVTSEKLLGFIVSEKGIKVNPDKVQAILDLPPPKTQKEVRGFLRRLNYIARFISQLTLKCDPIFKLLRKHNLRAWNEECQVAFDKVKEYLLSSPVLVPPVAERPLLLYLTVNERSMGSWTAHRLRQYMLYHTTWLTAKLDLIKYIFEKPSLSGRVARWQVLLSEYDIVYVSQKAIKGSAIADFLAERVEENYGPMEFEFPDEDLMSICQTNKEESEEKENWKMFFDGASNALGHGIGVVLVSPEGDHYPVIAKLNFYCTNNVAEYEDCVMGLQAAIEKKIHALEVYGDSTLVIYQLRGEWETRDSKLVRYHKYVSKLIKNFDKIPFTHLP